MKTVLTPEEWANLDMPPGSLEPMLLHFGFRQVRWPDSVVEDEFRKLEREVRQRRCSHDGRRHRIHEIAAHGVATWWVCSSCGRRWDARPPLP